jgi:hypothetical protein
MVNTGFANLMMTGRKFETFLQIFSDEALADIGMPVCWNKKPGAVKGV